MRDVSIPWARVIFLSILLAGWPAVDAFGWQDADPEEREPAVKRFDGEAGEEYQLDLSMPRSPAGADSANGLAVLPDPEQDERLQQLLARLGARPGDANALKGLNDLLADVIAQANGAMDDWALDDAGELLAAVRSVNPRQAGLSDAVNRLQGLRQVAALVSDAEAAAAESRWVEPPGDNALALLRRAQAIAPELPVVRNGLRDVQQALVGYAIDAARNLDFELAEAWLYEASQVREPQDLVEEARGEIGAYLERQADDIEQAVLDAIARGDFDLAEFTLIDLIALGGHEQRVANLRQRLARERLYGSYQPGQVIQDEFLHMPGVAPAVVVVAAGSFMMGSPESSRDARDNESPAHRVRIERGFALGAQEVTVAQFRAFVEATGYQTDAEALRSSRVWDDAMGRLAEKPGVNWRHDHEGQPATGAMPALHLSWNDAQAYLRWLTQSTGVPYRLPTEAEFEYALRAGTASQYWWGDSRPPQPLENLTGERDVSASGRHWSAYFRGYGDDFWGPAPAASFEANPFGLFDMAGNLSEWVQDCWHATYVRAPTDGSAWENPGCGQRVVRGGNWASAPEQARSAARLFAREDLRGPIVGFRIARDL